MYLCFYFFQDIRNENCPNKGSDAVRTLQSIRNSCLPDYVIRKPSVTFLPVTFHQRFGRLVEFECIIWQFWMWNMFYLIVIKTYDFFKAIKRLRSSTFSFILLHLLSYIFFKKKLVFLGSFEVCLWCHDHCWPFIRTLQLHCSLCGGRITVNIDHWHQRKTQNFIV